jgi:hypothetical protein
LKRIEESETVGGPGKIEAFELRSETSRVLESRQKPFSTLHPLSGGGGNGFQVLLRRARPTRRRLVLRPLAEGIVGGESVILFFKAISARRERVEVRVELTNLLKNF